MEDMIIKMAAQWKTFAFLPKTEIAQSTVQSRVVRWSKSAQGKSMPKDVLNLISAYLMTITTLTEISVQYIAARRNRYVLEVMACQITVCQSYDTTALCQQECPPSCPPNEHPCPSGCNEIGCTLPDMCSVDGKCPGIPVPFQC